MFFLQLSEKGVLTNIDLKRTNDDLACKVICPICGMEKALSSYVSESSGKISFSIYNFKRHYNAMHQSGKESNSKQFELGINSASTSISTSQDSLLQESTRSNCESCDMLRNDLTHRETELFELTDKVKKFNDLEAILAEKGK